MYMDKVYYNEYIKFREYYNVMQQWVVLLQKGIDLSDYLIANNCKKIVIYGMSDIGNCLAREITKDNKCNLLYSIDQGVPKLYIDVPCMTLEEVVGCKKPDIVIVTIPHLFEEIQNKLVKIYDCKIKSITEVIYNACYGMRLEE